MNTEAAITGAEILVCCLAEEGVEHVFGYPGGAVLPIYDELFQQDKVQHILVRQEGGAVHAAEGYARSTGRLEVSVSARSIVHRDFALGDGTTFVTVAGEAGDGPTRVDGPVHAGFSRTPTGALLAAAHRAGPMPLPVQAPPAVAEDDVTNG